MKKILDMVTNKSLYDKKLSNYQILNETYDKRLSSIQTVIIINTTFSSAIMVVLGVQLSIFNSLNNSSKSYTLAAMLLSFLAFIESLFCVISIWHLAKGCEDLRKTLYSFEEELGLFPMHKINKIKVSIILTIICCLITTIAFFICFLFTIFKLILLIIM